MAIFTAFRNSLTANRLPNLLQVLQGCEYQGFAIAGKRSDVIWIISDIIFPASDIVFLTSDAVFMGVGKGVSYYGFAIIAVVPITN